MEVTLKDVESNLENLPKEFLYQVNDFIDFLKYKHLNDQQYKIPDWQKEEVRRRVKYLQEHPESFISESEMNQYLNDIERDS
ncbi:hypothetical protein CHRY9390_00715 [Chryseobacterium aquaeductus]|uniref:DUF2281 domain-containing protein n=1 Tax=Chryseobacterium aquaeductus TaxID=2675056 RepID=A0A9N8MF74_9FLAO|nr:hypothetical protein [Chryseobacterium aquaeductus]CAA7330062.1 hypothetical protein CHRY9390_00715 [Chryseobacterium potabilaquae]CAD7801008.1 hypothetical protein CHRY9390_00715 [Chryseobacterium aquaeductus]